MMDYVNRVLCLDCLGSVHWQIFDGKTDGMTLVKERKYDFIKISKAFLLKKPLCNQGSANPSPITTSNFQSKPS